MEQTSQAFNQVGQLASSTADPESFQRDDKPGQFRSLQEACLVVDALGGQARQQQVSKNCLSIWGVLAESCGTFYVCIMYALTSSIACLSQPVLVQIESFCDQQMQPYAPLFPQGSVQAQLDQIDRRFAWFRRLLRGVDLRFDGVFPRHWRLQHRLCMRFLMETRADLLDVLEGGSKEAEDVTFLLKVIYLKPIHKSHYRGQCITSYLIVSTVVLHDNWVVYIACRPHVSLSWQGYPGAALPLFPGMWRGHQQFLISIVAMSIGIFTLKVMIWCVVLLTLYRSIRSLGCTQVPCLRERSPLSLRRERRCRSACKRG